MIRNAGAALGFQIDGAKPFFSLQNSESRSEPCSIVQYLKKIDGAIAPLAPT